MEKYYRKIKNRMLSEIVLAALLIPIAVYASLQYFHMEAPISGSSVLDFFGGMVNGMRSSMIAAFAVYLVIHIIRDRKAIKYETQLKELYITEHDERLMSINEAAGRMSFHIILYVIITAALIAGLFDTTAGLTLFCAWVFIVITRVAAGLFYNKRI
jgi:hypothetical protein